MSAWPSYLLGVGIGILFLWLLGPYVVDLVSALEQRSGRRHRRTLANIARLERELGMRRALIPLEHRREIEQILFFGERTP